MHRMEIRIEGQIDQSWMDWFECLSITYHKEVNQTLLIYEMPDQAALYGMITRLRDLGLKLISVNPKVEASDI